MDRATAKPTRVVVHAEALAWLGENAAPPGAGVVTSLPDVSELALPFAAWRAWFLDAARAVIAWTPRESAAIFYQSDVKHEGQWVDKGYLVLRAAEDAGARVLFHKIVCRKPPGTIALGRPSYSHMIAVTRGEPIFSERPGPDVLPDAGPMNWSRAMGEAACALACAFLRDAARATIVVDPFCGRGAVLAAANALGMDALGVDKSGKRCKQASLCVPSGPSDRLPRA